MTQSGSVALHGTLKINAGAVYSITSSSDITSVGAAGATVINHGALAVTGAATAATINGKLTNTGVITIGAGDVLTLANGTSSLGGGRRQRPVGFWFWQRNDAQHINVTVGSLALGGGNGGATLNSA